MGGGTERVMGGGTERALRAETNGAETNGVVTNAHRACAVFKSRACGATRAVSPSAQTCVFQVGQRGYSG